MNYDINTNKIKINYGNFQVLSLKLLKEITGQSIIKYREKSGKTVDKKAWYLVLGQVSMVGRKDDINRK